MSKSPTIINGTAFPTITFHPHSRKSTWLLKLSFFPLEAVKHVLKHIIDEHIITYSCNGILDSIFNNAVKNKFFDKKYSLISWKLPDFQSRAAILRGLINHSEAIISSNHHPFLLKSRSKAFHNQVKLNARDYFLVH